MRLVSYDGGRAGVVVDDHVVALATIDGAPAGVTALLAAGPGVAADVARKAGAARERRKSFDTHGPLGPWIVTADELDPSDLAVRTWVDDELRQDGSTADMVTGIGDMISAVSRVCTLEPGDLIATGTPGGVGAFTGGLLRPGQRVRIEVEGVGTIVNPVVAELEG